MNHKQYLLGFSNVSEQNPFTRQVGIELVQAAENHPQVTLIARNNDMDTPRAIRNSEEFAEANVDTAIVFHIDERNNDAVVKPLRDKGKPIISVDMPINMTTYYGLNNKHVGEAAGEVLAHWINDNWDGQIDKTLVMVEQRVLAFFQQRFTCALDKLSELVPTYKHANALFLDNGGSPDITAERVAEVLDRWAGSKRIAVVCMNDDVAVGTLQAIYDKGREHHTALMSHDCTEVAIREFNRAHSPMVVSTKLWADKYAADLIDLAIRLADRESVPQWNFAETMPMTPALFKQG